MALPPIIVNAKVYEQVQGPKGARVLAEACNTAAEEAGVVIGYAPPLVELAATARLDLPHVRHYGQHCDYIAPGSGTGRVTPEGLRGAGAIGSIINHAEHKIPHGEVGATVERLRALEMETLVCADGDAEVEALSALNPTYIAVEPPELIGGDISVTTADPGIVERAAARIREISPDTAPLCGAGVKTGKDVAKAIELGAVGVLLASGVVKHADPLAALRDLCSGL